MYDVFGIIIFIVIKNPWNLFYSNAGLLFDIATILHLSFRHLANNVATTVELYGGGDIYVKTAA